MIHLEIDILDPKTQTRTESNSSESHWVKRRRAKAQKELVRGRLLATMAGQSCPKLPASVSLTRLSSGRLDEKDNLPSSMKYIRDELAAFLMNQGKPGWWEAQEGKGDSPDDPISWEYGQRGCPRGRHGVIIHIEETP